MPDPSVIKFSDKEVKPDDDLISPFIGRNFVLWVELKKWLSEELPGSDGSWNYYNDGKQWIYKMTLKKKTLFWSGVIKDGFRVTFYFGGKAEPVIDSSDIPQVYKDNFKFGKRYGQIREISVIVDSSAELADVKKLVVIKKSLK
jgi:hypothetical protein